MALFPLFPPGLSGVYLIIVQLISTFLVHCPSHYLVGLATGIGFRDMRLGRTALSKVLPEGLSRVARFVPIITLVTDKETVARAPNVGAAAMYVSGTVASVASAVIFAIVATALWSPIVAAIAWAVSIIYIIFDAYFSPKSGDLSRARRILQRPR